MQEEELEQLRGRLAESASAGAHMKDLMATESWEILERWLQESLTRLAEQAVATGSIYELAPDGKTRVLLSPEQAALKHAMLVGEYQGKKHLIAAVKLFVDKGNNARAKLDALPDTVNGQ